MKLKKQQRQQKNLQGKEETLEKTADNFWGLRYGDKTQVLAAAAVVEVASSAAAVIEVASSAAAVIEVASSAAVVEVVEIAIVIVVETPQEIVFPSNWVSLDERSV
ncbi:hypothetical protein KY290_034200 [Solanum tuberosum]|uniref:Uncharacterized protein n=1 Tax=Solanum tuberosum TaxID=4113 RepID=A0ABQ7U2K5_SOLTU|nr:hypothetical protein KY289_033584 [Solanum tuberosum]KAH0741157.1 hypothetical protein KY290_034200 [Solanum tuberosum]